MPDDLEKQIQEINMRLTDLEYLVMSKISIIETRIARLEEEHVDTDDVQRLIYDMFRDYSAYIDSICYDLEQEVRKFKKGFHPVVIIGGKKDEGNIS